MNVQKVLSSAFLLILFSAVSLPQIATPKPSVGFSESIPYSPRLFDYGKKVKPIDLGAKSAIPANGKVTIPVTVLNQKGESLPGLSKGNFRIFVGDREEAILSVEQKRNTNIILVVDASPSAAARSEQQRKLADQIVRNLPQDYRISVVQFAGNTKVLCPFTDDRKVLKSAISKIRMDEGTSVYNAVSEIAGMVSAFGNGEVTSVIMLTDGVDTTSRKSSFMGSLVDIERSMAAFFVCFFDTEEERRKGILAPDPAKAAASEGAIGLAYLNDLIALSGGQRFSYRPSDSDSIASRIAASIQAQYALTFISTLPFTESRLPIRVRLDRADHAVLSKSTLITTQK